MLLATEPALRALAGALLDRRTIEGPAAERIIVEAMGGREGIRARLAELAGLDGAIQSA